MPDGERETGQRSVTRSTGLGVLSPNIKNISRFEGLLPLKDLTFHAKACTMLSVN